MGNELSLNVTSLADTIRDKVRSTIAASIPDEQINGLIKAEYDSFFAKPVSRGYSNEETRSQFQIMVRAEIDKLIKDKVATAVEQEVARFTNVNTWDAAGKKVVESMVREYAPAAIEGVAAAIVQSTMQRIQQNRGY